jgi:hypothetical protein
MRLRFLRLPVFAPAGFSTSGQRGIILGAIERLLQVPDNWFRAELSFFCPSCQKTSAETLIAAADKHNPDAVADQIKQSTKPLTCKVCGTLAPEGIKVQLLMNDLTPEELAKINFGAADSRRPV